MNKIYKLFRISDHVEFDCDGYDLYCENYPIENTVIIDDYYRDKIFDNPNLKAAIPQPGMKAFVLPGCPIAHADIRKDYVIKRRPEDADFIVYNTMKDKQDCWPDFRWAYIIPSERKVITHTWKNRHSNLLDYAKTIVPDILERGEGGDAILYKDCFCDRGFDYSKIWPLLEIYHNKLVKPVIYYKDLPIITGNMLTVDTLELVFRTALQNKNTKNAVENFILQMQALNQTNWRDNLGTMSMLYCCIRRVNESASQEAFNHSSKFPKGIKVLVETMRNCEDKFINDKDAELARAFIEHQCKFDPTQLTTIQELAKNFNDAGINFQYFYKLYDNRVQIRPHVQKN